MSTTTEPGAPHLEEMWVSTEAHRSLRLPIAAIAVLILTATLALLWSHFKLLDQDEIFVLQTDSVPTLHQLLAVQRHTPISLDPLVYHLLAHTAVRLFGSNAFALRLPSLAGFLLMQTCLFLFTRNLFATNAGGPSSPPQAPGAPFMRSFIAHEWESTISAPDKAGLFAMLFVPLTATLFYAAQARPYGLLLGFYALTMLTYQQATREQNRRGWLITLAAAIALTLNTHYFGILLLLPVAAAEFTRTVTRRKLDIPLLAALIAGCATIVFALPFQPAAAAFRKHYYNVGNVSFHAVTQAYRSLFVDYVRAPLAAQRIAAIAFVVLALTLIALCAKRLPHSGIPRAEQAFLIVLAALPFAGFLLGRFVTHTIEVRYVLGAILGIAALLALALTPLWHSRRATPVLAALALCVVAAGIGRITLEARHRTQLLATLESTPALTAALAEQGSDPHLYIQDMGLFEQASVYAPPAIRTRLALLTSEPIELRYDFHNTASLTGQHMRAFTAWPVVDYATFAADPRPHTVILEHSGWDWTDQAFAADHATVTPLGPALTGDAATVRFGR